MSESRRHFAGTEKVSILRKHLLEKVPVSRLCDELGLSPTQFYTWQKEFFENGQAAFDRGRKPKAAVDPRDRKIAHLEAKLRRRDAVLAELLQESMSRDEEASRTPE